MNFIINDSEINFELDNINVEFTLNDGVVNFKLNAVFVPVVPVSTDGFDYTLDFTFE